MISCQSSRRHLPVRGLECGEECILVGRKLRHDRCGARVLADERVDGKKAASVLHVFVVLVVEPQVGVVVVDDGQVEHIHRTSRLKLRIVRESERRVFSLQPVLNALAVADSDAVGTCSMSQNKTRTVSFTAPPHMC